MGLYCVPDYIDGKIVGDLLGKDINCPFCDSQQTSDSNDTGWVECPIIKKNSKWICYGCCLDIASTCISDDFEGHPYFDIVEEAAEHEDRFINEARRICLIHQLETINETKIHEKKIEYSKLKSNIEEQISKLYDD